MYNLAIGDVSYLIECLISHCVNECDVKLWPEDVVLMQCGR